jgi:superfamily I DNA and/or RNA helicase
MSCVKGTFDYLIIDEATQSTEISTLIPINLEPAKMVLIGDP